MPKLRFRIFTAAFIAVAACTAAGAAAPPSEVSAASDAEAAAFFAAVGDGDLARARSLAAARPGLVNAVAVVGAAEWAGMASEDPWEPQFRGKVSPLVLAVLRDRRDMAAWLLEAGARSDFYASFDWPARPDWGAWESSALFVAAERGDPFMVELLLNAGTDPAQRVRYFGGPPLPPSGDHGPDRSLFGTSYLRDSRARITVLDLCLTRQFYSPVIHQLVRRHAPRLKPAIFAEDLRHAALVGSTALMSKALDAGAAVDLAVVRQLVRSGNRAGLELLAARRLLPEGTGTDWGALGNLTAALDDFWFARVLRGPGMDDPQARGAFLEACRLLAADYPGLRSRLRALETGNGARPAGDPDLAMRLAFEPWLAANRHNASEQTAALARARVADAWLAEAGFLGDWQAVGGVFWLVNVEPGSIHQAGTDAQARSFETWMAPWRVERATESDDGGRWWKVVWQDRGLPWVELRRQGQELQARDEAGTVTRFVPRRWEP